MKKYIYSLIAFAVLSTACTELDVELHDRIPADKFPENATQASLMMIPVFKPMQDFLDWGGWWFCQDITTDEVVIPTRDTDWDDGGKWRVLHQHTWDANTEAVVNMWPKFYNGIVEANKLLEFLGPGAGTAEADAAIAKVKTMRAYYYYLLIDNYGDVPYVTSFSDAEAQPGKSKREDIWQNIVAELEESILDIPASTSKTSVTKGMAFSLLAKLYLNAEVYTGTAQWAKAEAACDSVIALGQFSLESDPLGPFITQNELSSENIFTIPFDEDSYTNFNLHMRTLHYNSNLTFDMPVGPWNGLCVLEDHYKSYEPGDLRLDGFLTGQQYTASGGDITDPTADSPLIFDVNIPALSMDASYTPEEIRMSGYRIVKFEIKIGARDNLSNDFPIFRYADILLMKAECMIRQGQNGDSYVNEIRSRAGVSTWTDVTLEQLLAERGREMFYEGHRRQDLIRFGEFLSPWWEKAASTPDRLLFPIPQPEIDANPKLADDI